MAKDPAVLLYYDKWLASTMNMPTNARAWYMDLIIHQYDKGSIPNEVEELAVLCRVKFSEYQVFEQVWQQVLKHKFNDIGNNRLANDFASEILVKRKQFKDKRSNAGKISAAKRKYLALGFDNKHFEQVLEHLDLSTLDITDTKEFQQVIQQVLQLYINVDVHEDVSKNKKESKGGSGENEFFTVEVWPSFDDFWNEYDKKRGREKCEPKFNKLSQKDKDDIMEYLPRYKQAEPDKQFRKDPYTFLNGRGWEDEIIDKTKKDYNVTKPKRGAFRF